MKFKNSRYSVPFPLLRISSQDNTRKLNFCFIKNEILSILLFFFFFFFSLLNLRPASRKNFQSSIPSTFLPNSRLYNKGLQRRNRITRIIVSLKARQLDRTGGRMYAYVAKRFKNSIRFSIL